MLYQTGKSSLCQDCTYGILRPAGALDMYKLAFLLLGICAKPKHRQARLWAESLTRFKTFQSFKCRHTVKLPHNIDSLNLVRHWQEQPSMKPVCHVLDPAMQCRSTLRIHACIPAGAHTCKGPSLSRQPQTDTRAALAVHQHHMAVTTTTSAV